MVSRVASEVGRTVATSAEIAKGTTFKGTNCTLKLM
jgi:hypothetical protein